MSPPKVVIIGGGFGGLTTARGLRTSSLDITLIDKTNHHLFQPLLYQVAVAALSRGDIATPLREVFRGTHNIHIILDEVKNVACQEQVVQLTEGVIRFDYLVIAPGSHISLFGHQEWQKHVFGLKTLDDATHIRDQMVYSFEKAERFLSKEEAMPYLTFVIVGGGPTGVELAGAIAEIATNTMRPDFPQLQHIPVTIILIHAHSRILTGYPAHLAEQATQFLQEMGVTVYLNSRVTNITPMGVQAGETFFPAANILWAAGSSPSPLLKTLRIPLDEKGRVPVQPDLSVPGFPNIFVVGDCARCLDADGKPLPALAAVASQQGRYVANILRHTIPSDQRKPFHYLNLGEMATVGRAKAVANLRGWQFSGFFAWILWSAVHIFYLIGFDRVRVMSEWIWYYLTFKSGERIITFKRASDFFHKRPVD